MKSLNTNASGATTTKASSKPLKIIGPYQIGEVIGRGSCGIVYKGLNRSNGKLVAIKQVQLDNIKEDMKGSVKNEIRLLKDFEHDRIVKYLDCIQSDEHLNIVLEYIENGSLDSLIKKFGKIPEHLVTIYIYQVLEGLVFLHEKGIIHRDIKGGNILTTKEGEVKLADFSVATTKFSQEQSNSQVSINNMSFAGTPYWMAPEVIQEEKKVTSACDIWSLGCTVIELLTEKPPYYEFKNPITALIKIVDEKNPPIPENLSDDLNDFLRLCFEIDHEKRSSARELLQHPWLRNAKEAEERNQLASAEKQIMQVEHQTSTERNAMSNNNDILKETIFSQMQSEDAINSKKESKRNSMKTSNQIHIAIKDLARQAHGGKQLQKAHQQLQDGQLIRIESPDAQSSPQKMIIQDSKRKHHNPSLITSKSHSHSTSKMSQRSIHLQASGIPQVQNIADQISSQDAQAPGESNRFLELTHKHDMKLDLDQPGDSNENLKMWAVSEIVQVFDKELIHSFENLETLPCEQDQEDAQVDDETETVVAQYRQASQKISDKIRQLLQVFQGTQDANQLNQRHLDRQTDSFAPLFMGQNDYNVENTHKIVVLERLSPLRLVQMLKTPSNLFKLQIQESVRQQLLADIRHLQHTAMQLINQICDIRDDIAHNYNQLCLSAIVSQLKIMASFGSQTPQELRVEIAYFILKACVTSNEAAMMIFSGEGYKILTNFLSIDCQSGQGSLTDNRILVYIAIDVFLLHFSPMLNHCLPTRKVLQSIFLKEKIHTKLGLILEKLCQDDQDSSQRGDSQQFQRTDIIEEKKVESKYIDKIFELLGYLIHGTTLQNKIEFCSVIDQSLVKIVRLGVDRKDVIDSAILGKATRRLLKLITQLIIGVPKDAISLLPIFQLRSQEQSPENLSQVISWLVEILKLYGSNLSSNQEQQQVSKSNQLTLLYDTLKLLSTLSLQSQSICIQASSCTIDQILAPLITHILALSPPLSLTKSLKLLSHLLSLLRNVRQSANSAPAGPPPIPSTPQSLNQFNIESKLLLQLLKFVHGHLVQIQTKSGPGVWPLAGQAGLKAREKMILLCQICDNALWLGLEGASKQEQDAEKLIVEIHEMIERIQEVVISVILAGGQGQWEQMAKLTEWQKVVVCRQKEVRIIFVDITQGDHFNQKLDQIFRKMRSLIDLQAQWEGQEREDYAAIGPERPHFGNMNFKQERAQLTKFVQSILKIIEACLFKGIDELKLQDTNIPDKSLVDGTQVIQEHLDTDIVSDSSSEQEGRNKVQNSRFFVDYIKKYLNTMPESQLYGGNLISLLRQIKPRFDQEQVIQVQVNSMIDPIIKTFENEGEHIPQPLFDSVYESNQMLIHSEQMVKERGIKMQAMPMHKHNSSETQQQQHVPQRTKNKSQNLVIKNASRHFVQSHEGEEDQLQLIQQVQQQQQKMQGKKIQSSKLNTYKPKQQTGPIVESYNSACNAKRAPPMMTAQQTSHQHLIFPPQQDFGHQQLYDGVHTDSNFYQSMPNVHSPVPQHMSAGQQHEMVVAAQRQPKNQMMRQQQQPIGKKMPRQEMSVIKYVNQHRNRQMMGAGTSPPPRYQNSQISHSANNTGYVGQMNMSSAMRRRQQYFQHHESGIANENQPQPTASSSLSNKHIQQSYQHTQGSHSLQRRSVKQETGSKQGKVRNRQQSSNSHQGNHGLALNPPDIQYQSANQQKTSQHLHASNSSNLMLVSKPKIQKVFKHSTINSHEQPQNQKQIHSTLSSHHQVIGTTKTTGTMNSASQGHHIQQQHQQPQLAQSHSTQLPHSRTSTQSASGNLLVQPIQPGSRGKQIPQDQTQFAAGISHQSSANASANATVEQQDRQPVQKKVNGGSRTTGADHPVRGIKPLNSSQIGQKTQQMRTQTKMDEPRKGIVGAAGPNQGVQRSSHGGQRGGRKGVGGVRVARSNNTQSMNVMNFQSLEHAQGRVLTEQALLEGSESHGQRNKIVSAQQKYGPQSMQRPLATEPAGGYSREFQNQLGDIEEGEESGDCGGLNNIENSTEEDEFNLGGNYFIYEKHMQSPRNKKNATTGFGTSLQQAPNNGLFNPVQGQTQTNSSQLMRSKSRDGAAKNRAHGGLIPTQGPPNLFKNNSQLSTKATGPGALMKSHDATPSFQMQAQIQHNMYKKQNATNGQVPITDNHRLQQQPIGAQSHQFFNTSMNLNNQWQSEMMVHDAPPMHQQQQILSHYPKQYGHGAHHTTAQHQQFIPPPQIHAFASPQTMPMAMPRKIKHGGQQPVVTQQHVGMYPQQQQISHWSNQPPQQPIYHNEMINQETYFGLQSQDWMDEDDEDEDGSDEDYGHGFQELGFQGSKQKQEDTGEYNAEEWTFSGQAHQETPNEMQGMAPQTFYHQQQYYQQQQYYPTNQDTEVDQMHGHQQH